MSKMTVDELMAMMLREWRKNMLAFIGVSIGVMVTMFICCGLSAYLAKANKAEMQQQIDKLQRKVEYVECVNDSRAVGNPIEWCECWLEPGDDGPNGVVR